jgi:hypothetical protein
VKNVAKLMGGANSKPKKKVVPKNDPALGPKETQHERDLRALQNLLEASCDSAREEFQSTLPLVISLTQRLADLEHELKELRSSCKCGGIAEPPNVAPTMAAVRLNDGLDIPDFLRRC